MADTTTAQVVPNGTVHNEKDLLATNGHVSSKPESFVSADDSFETTESEIPSAEDEWKPPASGPLMTPIPKPLSSSKPLPAPKLTAEQEESYNSVLATVSKWETIPATTAKGAPASPLTDHERMFLTRECLLRYLRATKWKTADAVKRLQSTLSWRREYGADTFTHEYISPEMETGKQVQLGFDNDGRPCLYLNPAKQNTKMSDRQIHGLSYMLDRTIDMMPPGVENSSLIINFKNAQTGNVPSVGQARAALNILQTHNPERLGKALISETPWYVNTFFKLISAFIDPITREKMRFNDNLRTLVPPAQLWDQHEGDLKFAYDHSIFWPAFYKECKKRREAYRERWEKAGKRIGESEPYLRGGNVPSLEQQEAAARTSGSADVDQVAEKVNQLNV